MGLSSLLAILLAIPGCGRIPGLYDAEIQATADDAAQADVPEGRRPDESLTTADAVAETTGKGAGVGGAGDAAGAGGAGGSAGSGGGGSGSGESPSTPAVGSTLGRGGGVSAGTMGSCSQVVASSSTSQPVDVLLVLDRSGSMNYNIVKECSCDPTANPSIVCADTVNCTTRWSSLETALDGTVSSTPYLSWGLKLFPSPNGGSCAVSKSVEVPIAADATSAIKDQIAATTPSGETPTASAILTATAYLKTLPDGRTKMILLATDGKPNCGGNPPSVYDDDIEGATYAISAAFSAGFLVYVIGIDSGPSIATVDAFAQAGGTGSHYAVESLDGLTTALSSISKAASCAFTLTDRPPDPNNVVVYLNKTMVPKSSSAGWSFGADPQTVLLHGTYCDQSLTGPRGLVQALFTCGLSAPTVLP
jgi:Mg-chelatase subunit ChlD